MRKKKSKFFASIFIMVVLIVMILLMVGIWMFILFYPNADGRVIDDVSGFIKELGIIIILPIIFAGVFPILGFILTCHKGFSVFEISEKGVKRSLFRVFKKTEIAWDELCEIRCYGMVSIWLFFSKTCLDGLSYNDIIKRKDVLQIEYSKQIIELVKSYTDKEILNAPKNGEQNN